MCRFCPETGASLVAGLVGLVTHGVIVALKPTRGACQTFLPWQSFPVVPLGEKNELSAHPVSVSHLLK